MVRWGISSTGAIAHQFARSLALLDDADLVAVGSRTAERANAFAEAHDVPHRHASVQLLADDPDVDVVYVASPHAVHHADVLTLLGGGKAVLCEKPFALSERQADEMVAAAQGHGVFLMEALWSRFLPGYLRLHELLAEGRIGAPRLLEANFAYRVPDGGTRDHRLFDPALGGGCLLDLGIYPINLAHQIFGEPTSVAAMAEIVDGIDTQTAILLGWDDGQLATLHAAVRTPGSNEARLAGEDGMVVIEAFMHAPVRLRIERPGAAPEVIDVPFEMPGYQYEAAEVHRCLAEGVTQSPTMPHDDTLAMMRTLDRARADIGLTYPGEG